MRGRLLPLIGALALLGMLLMPSTLLAQGEAEPGEASDQPVGLSEPTVAEDGLTDAGKAADPEDGDEPQAPAEGSPEAPAEAPAQTTEGRSDPPAEPRASRSSERPPTAPAERAPRATAAQAVTVRVGDFFFAPESITVDVGDTVTWVNEGEVPEGHTATARDGSFDTGVLQAGERGSHTFTRAGTFPYICSLHPQQQRGTVTVRSAARDAPDAGSEPGAPAEPGAAPGTADSPDAAGAEDSAGRRELPATGLEVLPLLLAGIASMALGAALGRRARLG